MCPSRTVFALDISDYTLVIIHFIAMRRFCLKNRSSVTRLSFLITVDSQKKILVCVSKSKSCTN